MGEPMYVERQSGQHFAGEDVTRRHNFFVTSLVTQGKEGRSLFIRIENPVFADSSLLVGRLLLDVVAGNAIGTNDFDGQHGRSIDEASAAVLGQFFREEANVRLGSTLLAQAISDPRYINLSQIFRGNKAAKDNREPGQQ